MAAFKRNLRITVGDDFEKRYYYKPGTPPVGFDFTGCTARLQIRPNLAGAAVIDLTTANGGITLGADGAIDIYISKTLTSALTLKLGIWALEITFTNNRVRTLIEGQVSVSPEIVR